MEIIILYWVFSTLYSIGIRFYTETYKLRIGELVLSILFGWVILPMTLGSKRGEELDK